MELATLETLYSTANGLRIRTLPTTEEAGEVVGKLQRGDVVKVVFGGIKKMLIDGNMMDIPTPWQPTGSDVQWIYVSQPVKGWSAMAVGNKVYLQMEPPKAGTPAEPTPVIPAEPLNLSPPKTSGSGTGMMVAVVLLGGLGAWLWSRQGKK